eukprot:TRINITY_DN2464_c0_g3_i1.p1 TRINITY_DN2464_c0_g3~~TRINITY_DN2464_c0_g3_i1.p1  ORF type:complete len:358 (+),score=56.42 TRINITY_DN2464_c0_g3_i1:103-1176(+)
MGTDCMTEYEANAGYFVLIKLNELMNTIDELGVPRLIEENLDILKDEPGMASRFASMTHSLTTDKFKKLVLIFLDLPASESILPDLSLLFKPIREKTVERCRQLLHDASLEPDYIQDVRRLISKYEPDREPHKNFLIPTQNRVILGLGTPIKPHEKQEEQPSEHTLVRSPNPDRRDKLDKLVNRLENEMIHQLKLNSYQLIYERYKDKKLRFEDYEDKKKSANLKKYFEDEPIVKDGYRRMKEKKRISRSEFLGLWQKVLSSPFKYDEEIVEVMKRQLEELMELESICESLEVTDKNRDGLREKLAKCVIDAPKLETLRKKVNEKSNLRKATATGSAPILNPTRLQTPDPKKRVRFN